VEGLLASIKEWTPNERAGSPKSPTF